MFLPFFHFASSPKPKQSNYCKPFLFLSNFFYRSFLILTPPPPIYERRQGHTKLPDYVSVGQFPRTPLRDLFTAASGDTLNLLSKCIIYEPRRRISAKDVRTKTPFPFPSSPTSSARAVLCYSNHALTSPASLVAGSQPSLLLRTPIPYTPVKAPKNGRPDGGVFPSARRSRRKR
jgi:hypothetical protein